MVKAPIFFVKAPIFLVKAMLLDSNSENHWVSR
jgi:hypothetical protein